MICRATLDTVCNETDVLLVDGVTPHEGRVAMCVNGMWSSVCGRQHPWERDSWDIRGARVVCRQLGYDTG